MKNFILFLGLMGCTLACTNFLVTKGASKDNTNMISYAADSHVLYGELYHRPAADHKEGEMIDIIEWDTGMYAQLHISQQRFFLFSLKFTIFILIFIFILHHHLLLIYLFSSPYEHRSYQYPPALCMS